MIGEHQSIRLDPLKGKLFPMIGLGKLILSMPFIYVLMIPIGLLDLLVSLYQWICFPIYRLTRIHRNQYIQLQRKGLESLNIVDRLNCYYCSYANGVLRYAQKVASETEKMWCPIRQKQRRGYLEPVHHVDFTDSGCKEALLVYYAKYEKQLDVEGQAQPTPAEEGAETNQNNEPGLEVSV
jgi:hypothetical protein